MEAIEAEANRQYDLFRKEFKTEEASRIKRQVEELKEDLFTWQSMANLDSYLHYFYQETGSLLDFMDKDKSLLILDEPVRIKEHVDAVELEFKDSMSNRLEKGYILPGQTRLLYASEEVAAGLASARCWPYP